MSEQLKLRVIEAYPERWLKILPAYPNESEDEYKLRVMNISIPQTRDEDFRKAYFAAKPWNGVLTTKCIKAMLLYTKGKDSDEKFIDFLITYGEKYLLEFYNSFVQNYNPILEGQMDDRYYIPSLIRALYRLNRNFYRTLNVPNQYSVLVIQAILLECVIANDEETFDNVIDKLNPVDYLYEIARISHRKKTVKYVKKIIQYMLDSGRKYGFRAVDRYRTVFEYLHYDPILCSIAIQAISEISERNLQYLLEIADSEKFNIGYRSNVKNVYSSFHLTGLSVEDITEVVNKIGNQNTKEFLEWFRYIKQEDV